ncbi:MAG: 23S rRNA (guanosine(2251)-2'-O)-methyltransferase RlmB [Deltaproteobacteria bacterium]|nr:MAG: 23S rRNA (guanosine(2251)-2'-O)-methyltransferase RlmB [Deltaproteobacteria bacterium]
MIIFGRNPVKEALVKDSSKVEEVYISEEAKGEKISEIVRLARERNIKVSFLSSKAIFRIAATSNHQGVAAKISEFNYSSVEEIVERARIKGDKLLAVVLDHIEDPQNLGAIVRTVNVLGAHGVIIPKDRATGVTPAVVKASAGATSFVPIARVVNLVRVIRELKERGVWIVGADPLASRVLFEEKLGGLDLVLVIGSEGKGLHRLVKEECDFLVSIPCVGEVSSLNASVAAGILIYEIIRQRRSEEI